MKYLIPTLFLASTLLLGKPNYNYQYFFVLTPEQIEAREADSQVEEAFIAKREEDIFNAEQKADYERYLQKQEELQKQLEAEILQAEYEAKEWIAFKESSGRYDVYSPCGRWYGRYQLTLSYLNGDFSPENQERVADDYVAERYGSWVNAKAFWESHGWY